MSNKKERNIASTQSGLGVPEKPKPRGCDDTIPVGAVRSPQGCAQPSDGNVITSASSASVDAKVAGAGVVTLSGERVAEALARELIVRCMTKANVNLAPDMSFSYGDLLVTLDGYDNDRRIGYQFVSHSGADVVTDFDSEVEARLAELAQANIAHILVIHDHLATDADSVLEQVDKFLANLPSES
ncbi:MAG: hypothetical protein JKY56_04425 [Kofleriaceae bacterium]|nr:hypothetical protein [Kofleriaceae bacterium]